LAVREFDDKIILPVGALELSGFVTGTIDRHGFLPR
jgi:hypothetical protein